MEVLRTNLEPIIEYSSFVAVFVLWSGNGVGRCHESQSSTLTVALSAGFTAALSTVVSATHVDDMSAGAAFTIATRPTGFAGRITPAFTTSDRCPAIRLVGIEILNGRRGGVVALGIVCAVGIKRQWRVVIGIGLLIVLPLLMLGCLSPIEVAW